MVVTVVVVLLGNKLVDGSLVDQFVLWQVMMMMMLHDALEWLWLARAWLELPTYLLLPSFVPTCYLDMVSM